MTEQPGKATESARKTVETPSKLEMTFDRIKKQLPPSAVTAIDKAETQLRSLAVSGRDQFDDLTHSKSIKSLQTKLSTEQWFSCAYSVTNATAIALSISLNQVGPLFYAVILPDATFERRVPPLPFYLQVRAYSKEGAYTPLSVAWPIVAVTGPIVATVSILAIPITAVAIGGSALASLLGFGSVVAESAAVVVGGAASAAGSVAHGGKTLASLSAKASIIPGVSKLHSKLVSAARETVDKFQDHGKEFVRQRVVRYYTAGEEVATAALAGATTKSHELRKQKLEEIDVTGLDVTEVLRCETKQKKINSQLKHAFERLSIKTSKYLASTNPVLRIVGGPELEQRGEKQLLVFYPFVVEEIVDIAVEAIPISEVPPSEPEAKLVEDVAVVADMETASSIDTPLYGSVDKFNVPSEKSGVQVVVHEEKGPKEKVQKKSWFW